MWLATTINVYYVVVLPTLLYGCEAFTPYHRHIRRFDQFHMRCLSRIANIKWQDMIPNTEVLQRCIHNGIELHIKRAQLRWSGHFVRMADDRIPKTVFYGELDAGHRTRGGKRKRCKDVLKATLKSCGIPHNTWEATATDRSLWRSTCHSGLRDYEEKRCDALRDKIMRRNAIIQPSTNIDTCVCHVCGRICASRIGLHSHNRTHANTNTDCDRDPSYRRLTPYIYWECRAHMHIHLLLYWKCRAHMHIHLLLFLEYRAHMHIHMLLCWEYRAHMLIHLLLYCECRAHMLIHLLGVPCSHTHFDMLHC